MREYLAAAEAANRPVRDNCRVVLTGPSANSRL